MKHKHIAKRFWEKEGDSMQQASDAAKKFNNVINLSLGDTDIITDERIIKSAMEDALKGHTKYASPHGDPELIGEIIKSYSEDYGLAVTEKQVLVTPSSCMGMELALMAILDQGDEVIIFSPYFTPYKIQTELAGGRAVEVLTYEEDGFEIKEDNLRAAISSKTKAMIFNNPCNPTGTAYSEECCEMLAKIAAEFDLIVVADEIYTGYMYTKKFIPFRSLANMSERTITLNSFSKNYMMTGWRVGYMIAQEHFIETAEIISENMVYAVPSVSQRAGIYALRLRGELSARYSKEYFKRTQYVAQRVNAIPFLSVIPPQGTFYLFVNIKKTGLSSAEFCSWVLENAQVALIPGTSFGNSGEGYIRIACTTSIDVLGKAFDRIEKLKL